MTGKLIDKNLPKPLHIDLTDEFAWRQDGEPRVILTWTPAEFATAVYRIVFCAKDNKYVKEVRKVNSMGEPIWVFDAAYCGDNHNNSFSGFQLCNLIRFLCSQPEVPVEE